VPQAANPLVDPVSQDFLLQQKTKENDAYLKAQESVKVQEASFAKGAVKGAVSSIPEGAAALVELFGSGIGAITGTNPAKGLTDSVSWLMKNKLLGDTPQAGEAAGFDAGNVIGNVSQVAVDPFASMLGTASKAGLFLGVKAGSTRLGDAAVAASKLSRGYTPMDVWKETGFFNLNQGVKDAPIEVARHVSVANVGFSRSPEVRAALAAGDELPITEALSNFQDIAHEYPNLFTDAGGFPYTIGFKELPPNVAGIHYQSNRRIVLNSKVYTPDGATSNLTPHIMDTITHEIQHAIQSAEGWLGTGSNPRGDARTKAVVLEDFLVRRRNDEQARLAPVLNEALKNYAKALEEASLIKSPTERYVRERAIKKEYGASILNQDKIDEFRAIGIEMPVWARFGNIPKPDQAMEVTVRPASIADAAMYFYKTDIGEVWSRAAGKSHSFTQATLDETPPWRLMDVPPSKMSGSGPDPAKSKGFAEWLHKQEQLALNNGIERLP
jgi:hypothetical protein